MTEIMWLNVGLAVANALLALVLTGLFASNYRQVRSTFTLALLGFAAFFVLHNVTLVYHYVTMFDDFVGLGLNLMVVEGLLQAGAMGAILYASTR